MKVTLSNPIAGVSGTHKGSCLSYFQLNGLLYGRSLPEQKKDSPTGPQITWRSLQVQAKRAWKTLTIEQVKGWNYYGKVVARYTDGRTGGPRGYDLFSKVTPYRLAMGLPMMKDAPTEPAPPPVVTFTVLPSVEPDEFSFEVQHGVRQLDDHFLYVRITPATQHAAYEPQEETLRSIRNLGPDSFSPLPESGGAVTFTGCRFEVTTGRRFMAEMRIVRATDAMISEPLALDLVR